MSDQLVNRRNEIIARGVDLNINVLLKIARPDLDAMERSRLHVAIIDTMAGQEPAAALSAQAVQPDGDIAAAAADAKALLTRLETFHGNTDGDTAISILRRLFPKPNPQQAPVTGWMSGEDFIGGYYADDE